MEEKKSIISIETCVDNIKNAKEILNELEPLMDKYELTINLTICPSPQMCYTLT